MYRSLLSAAGLAAFLLLPAGGAQAAMGSEPDWPCIQRKVPALSYGTMWTGPAIDDVGTTWRDDDGVRELVRTIRPRRVSIEDGVTRIDAFAATLGDDRQARLVLLFAGLFQEIDRERGRIIDGITRYARKQVALTELIQAETKELRDLDAIADPTEAQDRRAAELEDKIAWDTRIFDEREHSLTFVCESPVILEQRVYAYAQAILKHLD